MPRLARPTRRHRCRATHLLRRFAPRHGRRATHREGVAAGGSGGRCPV